MEIKDILQLVNAGFTKDDIMTLSQGFPPSDAAAGSGETDKKATEAPQVAGIPDSPAGPAPAPAEEAKPPVVDNSEVLSAIKALTATIQKNAILKDDLKVTPAETAEDILGSIINPTKKK